VTKYLGAEIMATVYKERGQGKKRGNIFSVLDE
jgi:hypothetical protein